VPVAAHDGVVWTADLLTGRVYRYLIELQGEE
jgi:hypothetical protein